MVLTLSFSPFDIDSAERLSLYRNQLSGPIPSEIGSLASLVELKLDRNQLSGPIPSEIGSLANLEELLLYSNNLSGTIPTELGSLSQLCKWTFDSDRCLLLYLVLLVRLTLSFSIQY